MAETVFNNIDPAMMKRIKNLRLIDDELMTVVFSGDKKATELLIRILLNRNDLRVTKSMTQEQKHNLFGRSVTLDIVAEDIFKTEYNIEIQRAGKGAGAKRIRYHQAMIDSHTLKKNQDAVGHLQDFVKIRADEEDSHSPVPGCDHLVTDKARGSDIEPTGRMRHDEEIRTGVHFPGENDLLLVAS